MPAKGSKIPDLDRLMSKVAVRESGCWEYLGTRNWSGYGMIWDGGFDARGHPQQVTAHRLAYELFIGPIPAGYQVDHLCHVSRACHLGVRCPHRPCVNPTHLEAVTVQENIARTRGKRPTVPDGGAMAERQRRKTHCPQGHAYDAANTSYGSGGRPHRECRTCQRTRAAARRARCKSMS